MTEVIDTNTDITYKGHQIVVRRVDAESAGYPSSYEYEFELLVDGEVIKTATDLERDDFPANGSWSIILRHYGKAYISGMED